MQPSESRKNIGRLHVIVGDGGRPSRSIVDIAAAAIDGGADTIQYRRKEMGLPEMLREAEELLRLCRDQNTTFIVNDRIDLCLAVDADGVHLGQEDMPIFVARRLLGSSRLVGGTIRNVVDLKQAESDGADYVGLGPIFATASKKVGHASLGLEVVREVASEARIPVIGIAGVVAENAGGVIAAGAWGVAVIGAVAGADDPAAAALRLRQVIDRVVELRT